jgi:ubiquinone/menaquinone biosynthesis C-methylase UbiE
MPEDVARQYATADPLRVRMRTHELYEERRVDLDEICHAALELQGDESLLDAGCGPGRFLALISGRGHRGRLVGLDQSAAMVDEIGKLAVPGHRIEAVHGDVQSLPFDVGAFERVVARHMLYHVPDIPAGLAELRRVLRPDGLLLATTNSGRSLPHILDLTQDLLAAFGQPAWIRPDERFSIENAVNFLTSAGFEVDERIIDNALIFHAPEPIAAYCASLLPSLDIGHDAALVAEMEAWLAVEAERRLNALGGVWRDPKRTGVYVGRSL